jgi:leucyl/phenylalanyl-tRNA--protein transferase
MPPSFTAEQVLRAYALGVFPMARHRDDPRLYWIDPEKRGILPLDGFHLPRSLRKALKKRIYTVQCDTAFEAVMMMCAEHTAERPDTWINDEILRLFIELHRMGVAHSVESWSDGRLVGGLYGLSLGGVFFGESMFSRATNASKVALAHLMARLWKGGYSLLDTQFVTDHLAQFGTVEIPRQDYLVKLSAAMRGRAVFHGRLGDDEVLALLSSQSSTQTS